MKYNSEITNLYVPKSLASEYIDSTYNESKNLKLIIMDMYLIGRLFRYYKGNDEARNSIIYAGNDHINNYKKFEGYKTQRNYGTTIFSIFTQD